MTRTTLLRSTMVLVVLAALGSQACRGDPPTVIDPGVVADRQASQTSQLASGPLPSPYVADWCNSGCLLDPEGDPEWPCGEDEFELIVEANTLRVVHRNATYNCCPDDIVISLSVEGNLLVLTEEEILPMPCDCWCCYDVEATVVDLAPGTYTVEFCWFDYETWELQCYVDEIVIPARRGDPPATIGRDDLAFISAAQSSPRDPSPLGGPYVDQYSSSGCLDDPNDPWFPPCGDDEIEFTVEGDTLHLLHRNATYNCCPDEIVVSASLEGNVLTLTEEEIVPDPCYCICCYNVEATVVDLAPGTYTVEFCWYDYDTYQTECYVEEIEIPGRGKSPPGDGPPRGDPPVVVGPDAVADLDESTASQVAGEPLLPRIDDYWNSGCLDDPNDPWFPPCGDDEIELTVEGHTLYVLHRNATYNCCPDDIVISLSQEGNLLRLTEDEILTLPCWCICCYNVEAAVVDLASGQYVVEFRWFDYEALEIQCYVEEIVIP